MKNVFNEPEPEESAADIMVDNTEFLKDYNDAVYIEGHNLAKTILIILNNKQLILTDKYIKRLDDIICNTI